ncbi:hypothetical protein BT96DRAFT_997784 [Gymnopus androsaceus JB14]|uniref:Ubiquitin-like protease family profile domain-containing protein n=1 Tax=Gymnopus androsaceus JB14 TaxID=1447944 RepID=A0A6A4HDC5_9AGAR|nr:hypothetical protein BT96DRAFT_997784 [Gymnopus androsaceus JB14]
MDPTSTGQGKLYKKAPKSIKAAVKQTLAIPTSIRSEILPDENLSILDLLTFPLPNEPAVTTKHGLTATSFFSQSPPDSTPAAQLLTKLRHLPIPPQKLIRAAVSNARQLIMDGAQSVIYAHISTGAMTKFPLWVIMFWEEVLDAQVKSKDPWSQAKAWLDKKLKEKKKNGRVEERKKAEEVLEMLGLLPWKMAKVGLSDCELISTLARFLSKQYTSGSNQNDILELLCIGVSSDLNLVSRYCVEDSGFIPKLLEAFNNHKVHEYSSHPQYTWIWNLGHDLFNKGQGEFEEHWVSVHINFAEKCLMFDDPLTKDPPVKLHNICLWWINQHDTSDYTVEELPITRQEDGYSCGPLTSNTDANAVVPAEEALIPTRSVDLYRMQLFCKLRDQILEARVIEQDIRSAGKSDSDSDSGLPDVVKDEDQSRDTIPSASSFIFTFPPSPIDPQDADRQPSSMSPLPIDPQDVDHQPSSMSLIDLSPEKHVHQLEPSSSYTTGEATVEKILASSSSLHIAGNMMEEDTAKKKPKLMTDFFGHVTAEEKAKIDQMEWEELHETMEEKHAQKKDDAIKRKAEQRADWRKRQQKHRELVKSKKKEAVTGTEESKAGGK